MKMPRDLYPDSTIPLLLNPYRFISATARRLRSDLFFGRLMLKPTVFMTGKDAAKLFYNERYFRRSDAAPLWLQKTLFGEGGVQTVDDDEHKKRKGVFMALASPERTADIAHLVKATLAEQSKRWIASDKIVLYGEFQEILTKAVCGWAGVPLASPEIGTRVNQLVLLFDKAGSFGIGHVRSRRARGEAERWIGSLIRDIRSGAVTIPRASPASVIAHYRDSEDGLLDIHRAAVELLNLLRPTVAVSVYATFAALALHQYPACRQKVETEGGYLDRFVDEVRRFFPFFPSVMAKVRQDFEWEGFHFREGWSAVLDLYGINHDPRIWKNPERFEPERFRRTDVCPFNFVPQGGGKLEETHRCPGESITIELMKVITIFLTRSVTYTVPPQRLALRYSRLPALPRDEVIIADIRKKDYPRKNRELSVVSG